MRNLPTTITSAQLENALRRVPVTVHNADGSTTQSNLFDQADAVRNGTVQVHVGPRGTFTQAAPAPAAAPTATVERDDDGTISVSATFTFRGL